MVGLVFLLYVSGSGSTTCPKLTGAGNKHSAQRNLFVYKPARYRLFTVEKKI